MATHSQANRAIRVISSYPDDTLMLVSFSGEEIMSAPGGFTLELAATKAIPAKDVLLKPMGVVIDSSDGTKRYFHGLVRRFSMMGQNDDLLLYRAEIVPWIWFLGQVQDSLVFQNLSVPDIVEKVFKDHGFSDFESRLLKSYPKREYTVQYRESCLDFVSRLLEDEGIFYFFEHDKNKHTLVLADNPSKIVACPGIGKVTMLGGAAATADADTLESMHEVDQVTTGKVTYSDFNFEKPTSQLRVDDSSKVYNKLEHYDYPGGYMDPDEGNRYIGLKLEELESTRRMAFGTGSCRAFTAGKKFALVEHSQKEMNIDWTLLRVSHAGKNGDYRSSSGSSVESYTNSFVAMPHSVIFRPAEVTRRPIVHGTQTAIVVGPSGEEIYTDKYGRVKVQFHWDRTGKKDENSSMWVRVATPWAGKTFGMIAIPRIGCEVVVDFLEGDPDRPLIVGMVYNADYMPPWELPANQTQLGILTRSTKQGGAANANALRFEDKKGSEQVWLHAEKNQDIEVENDETHWVGHDRKKTIDNDETTLVKGMRTETVDKDETVTVHGKQNLTVDKDQTLKITEGNQELVISQGNRKTTLAKGKMETILDVGDQITTLKQGNQTTNIKMGNQETKVDMGNVSTKLGMGNYTIKLDLGKVTIEAMQEIELKVGQSSIKVSQMGVEIKGMMAKMEGQVQASIKGVMTEVKGDAMLQAKGAITMIG